MESDKERFEVVGAWGVGRGAVVAGKGQGQCLLAQASCIGEPSCLQENVCYSFRPDTPGEEHNFFCDWR